MVTRILPKLILHIDINKTIMLGDSNQSQSLESSLLTLLCEYPLGIIDKNTNEWILIKKDLNNKKYNEGLISYMDYLRIQYPQKTANEIQDNQTRIKYNLNINKIKRELAEKFIDKGSPGELLKNQINQIIESLKIPDNILEKMNRGYYSKKQKELYNNGYIQILKSFFNSMIQLTKSERHFSIIFRSFGDDIESITSEFNEFCKGKHPLYPNIYFDGTHKSKNYLIGRFQYGILYRYSKNLNDIFLVIGTKKRFKNPKPNNLYEFYNNDIKDGNVIIIEGGINIYNYIMEKIYIDDYYTFAIFDEYEIWLENDNLKEYSKPFYINPYERKIHQIFFDDNIVYEKKISIVDCRNIITGETIPDNKIKNKYIIKTDINVLLDDFYFSKKILEAELNRKKDFENDNNRLEDKIMRLKKIINDSYHYLNEALKTNENLSFTEYICKFISANKLYIDEGK